LVPITTFTLDGETETATGSTTVTVAEADLVVSACEVAFTVTVGGAGTEAGAVYRPALVIAPQAAPAQPAPAILQVTAVFAVPVTVALNCRLAPVSTFAKVGETETAIGDTTVTTAEADLVTSACEVAVTVTVGGFGTLAGAV
jgi:hypothetical protein